MILLRFDDICETMNWEQWNKAKDLLDKTGVKALLGVIPDCQDPDLLIDTPREDFWEYIRHLQDEGYTVAMHGLHHVFDVRSSGIVTKKKHSEFAGHSYEEQFKRIKDGKEKLLSHGIETDVFFAPAHSYDDNTLKALAANGFKYISDGFSNRPYMRHGIVCVPCRSAGVPKIKRSGYYTVVLHAHEWVRTDKEKAWYDFCDVCKRFEKDIVPFDVFCSDEIGNAFIQKKCEKLYLIWSTSLKPYLSQFKSFLLRL